jgi:hypothetical protein
VQIKECPRQKARGQLMSGMFSAMLAIHLSFFLSLASLCSCIVNCW